MNWKHLKILSGPVSALLLFFIAYNNDVTTEASLMAGIALWMAVWWMAEVVHMAITSLLPMVLLPVLGIAKAKDVSLQYMDSIIFLFIGGFIIAFAIEKWNLHKRIALMMLSGVGVKPANILLGIMLATWFISMWISNTATVMMMISAVYAIIKNSEEHFSDQEQFRKFSSSLLIGLAYSATIGGMATLVGTPTNMIFYRTYQEHFKESDLMNFAEWMKIGFPVSLLMLFFCWWILKTFMIGNMRHSGVEKSFFKNQLKELGKMSADEKIVLSVFSLVAVLWMTRSPIDFGSVQFHGWSKWFGAKSEYINDSVVAIFGALILFLIPSSTKKEENIMSWKDAESFPFDIILLFGGGFALALGIEQSGLSTVLAAQLEGLAGMPIIIMIAGLCLLITVISEFASNVASIQLALPVLMALAGPMHIHPLTLMIPATLAASLGFMLPVATAPNTIVYGSRKIKASEMYKAGFWVNLAGITLITLLSYLLMDYST
ncbi:MAG: SLC13 family permease [Bacteroidia bacterium]